ncbi:hypothetical protein [Sinosporangium siamense]|uniref:Uncharacterized protein n=1 Tax=Sinosporangium siamense TaxID=1367973 RepID=A0A919VC64_9ACTN|nr:hypothetical protein [Sinosporangium siamense]GII97277.1 hypothetical protein Ssi02_75080 [Sinosporangium siamense]
MWQAIEQAVPYEKPAAVDDDDAAPPNRGRRRPSVPARCRGAAADHDLEAGAGLESAAAGDLHPIVPLPTTTWRRARVLRTAAAKVKSRRRYGNATQ